MHLHLKAVRQHLLQHGIALSVGQLLQRIDIHVHNLRIDIEAIGVRPTRQPGYQVLLDIVGIPQQSLRGNVCRNNAIVILTNAFAPTARLIQLDRYRIVRRGPRLYTRQRWNTRPHMLNDLPGAI